ncbi:MAG TPA: hypothetical protein VG406_23655 [Isosphaeraceae bacterium]|jgi:hypothetical protein|nr:hypothetical protein [Isosphaeraceae bacterium]
MIPDAPDPDDDPPSAADRRWWAGQSVGWHEDHPSYDLDCRTLSANRWHSARLAREEAEAARRADLRDALAGRIALD